MLVTRRRSGDTVGEKPVHGAARLATGPKLLPLVTLSLLVIVTVLHLLGQLIDSDSLFTDLTQILLMPLLGAVLLSWIRCELNLIAKLVLAALSCSWLGDTLPRFMSGDAGFLTMVGCFLIAQAFYIFALWPLRASSILRRPIAVLPYLIALAVLVLWCAPGAGNLLIPVLIYGVALSLMAVLSTGLGIIAGTGGAIFFFSDALIALRSFAGVEFAGHGFWIMLSYVLGQTLIVTAVLRRHGGPVAISPRDESA